MDRNEGSLGSTLLVFLLGAAVGATVAILYAPMSGTETRAQIAEKAGQVKDKANELSQQVADKASQLKATAMSKVQDTANRLAQTADTASDKMQTVADSAGKQTGTEPPMS